MPRRSKGPRLWLRRAQYDRNGRFTHAAVWLIKDGQHRESTGCSADDRRGAEAALAAYISVKHLDEAQAGVRPPARIPVADVLALYGRDVAPKHSRPRETAQRIAALLGYFGDKVLSEINGGVCRSYVEHRRSSAAARRELEDLRAAINHHRREGLCSAIVEVVLPERASGGSPAPRRLAYFGPRGAIVRSKRAGPQTDAHGNISRGSFCLPFTPGLAPVPSVEQPYSLLSAADGLMSLAACSIAGRRARERPKSENRQSPFRQNCTAICGAGKAAGSSSPLNGLVSRCLRSRRHFVQWPQMRDWALMLRRMC